MKMTKRLIAAVLMLCLLGTLSGCGNGGSLVSARAAWSAAMGSRTAGDRTSMTHIRYTSIYELADALGIDASRTRFSSSGLFESSGHLFGIVQSGKPLYVVALNDENQVTWCFDVQDWRTTRGYCYLGALEFTMLATAVTNSAKAVYPQAESAKDNVWHRLTDKQIQKLND